MIILGIHDGHNASAAIIKKGKLICSIAEERLSRQKNHYGYPAKAIQCVLDFAGVTSKDIDKVAMSSKHLPPAYFYTSRNSKLSYPEKEMRNLTMIPVAISRMTEGNLVFRAKASNK